MTTSLGIAATTAVLRHLLQNAIPAAQLAGVLGAVDVTALPPDRIDTAAETSKLNLFMYQVTPNSGWWNADQPSHDKTGRRLTNPPLALDLSYMLSAYGGQNFHGEILLGYGALLLHQTRVLTRDTVKAAFAGGALPADLALLATSGLDGQEELISLSMESLTIDDMSRLWSVFGEKYRPSIAFRANVVLLRGADPAMASGPPVKRPRLAILTSINPTIDSVDPALVTAGPGATIDLLGTGLLNADALVSFGSGETAAPEANSTALRVRVSLPTTLRAGVNTVRVSLKARFETDLRGGPESNVIPFTLRPAFLLGAGGNPRISVGPRTNNGDVTKTKLTVKLRPEVGKRQAVALLLNEIGVAAGAVPHAYSIDAPSRQHDAADTTDTIAFALNNIHRARYLVRVRVDGAETELGMAGGVYATPSVDLT
jgi:hypothetical protein